jgi:hypothetical protein
MQKLEKFIKALELVKVNGVYGVGLVINQSGEKVNWTEYIANMKKVIYSTQTDDLTVIKKISQAMKNGEWVIVEVKSVLSSEVFSQFKLLARSNRVQFSVKEKLIEFKQSGESRVVVFANKEMIEENKKVFSDFINIFSPVIII